MENKLRELFNQCFIHSPAIKNPIENMSLLNDIRDWLRLSCDINIESTIMRRNGWRTRVISFNINHYRSASSSCFDTSYEKSLAKCLMKVLIKLAKNGNNKTS